MWKSATKSFFVSGATSGLIANMRQTSYEVVFHQYALMSFPRL